MEDQDMNTGTEEQGEAGDAMPPAHTPGHTSTGDEADVAAVDEDETEENEEDDAAPAV